MTEACALFAFYAFGKEPQMKQRPRFSFGGLGVILVILLPLLFSSAFAQGERSALDGIVTDQTGAVVAGAEVTVTHTETNIETKTTTTDAGVYRLSSLPAGKYKITVKANGFQTAVLNDVNLFVAQTLTVDIKLTPGQVTEQVIVSATPSCWKRARPKSDDT